MRIAIIGRTEILFSVAVRLHEQGHTIAVIITAKAAPEYTKNAEDFCALAESLQVPCVQTPRISEAMELVRDMPTIDIGISLNYTGIIPQKFIDLFPMGILNAHGGDLPRYRGNACQAWAILNGEDRIGLCIHKMIGGELDSGDIIARDYYPLTLNTKVTETYQWMSRRIPPLFEEAIAQLEKDAGYVLERQSTAPEDALRCYPRRPEDGRIDWQQSNIDILRLINACNKPYAGAFCLLAGQTLTIWDATLAPAENFLAIPGQVTAIGDGYIEVAAAQGKLRVTKVQQDERTLAPNQIIKSIRTRLT